MRIGLDRPAQWMRRDAIVLAACLALAAVPRIVLRTRGSFSVDSALLALGVREYDLVAYHPHPPFYPLTIAFAKVLAWGLDEFAALTWLAILSSLVMTVCVVLITRALAGRVAAAYAGTLAALSPVALGNAVVPLSYASEGAASALVALLALNAEQRPRRSSWVLLGVVASLAVGFRPSAALTAAPLMLWATWRSPRALAWSVGAGAVATGTWLVAALAAGGGLEVFLFGNAYQSRVFILSNPAWQGGWEAIANNVAWQLHHLRAELAFLGACALLALVAAGAPWRQRGAHAGLLATWLLPSLAFYVFVYAGWPIFPSGYLLGMLPALFVAAAVSLRRVLRIVREPGVPRAAAAGGLAVVLLVAALPATWPFAWDEELRTRDAADAWVASLDGLREAYPPATTAILASYAGPWMVLEHPDYLTYIVESNVLPDGTVALQLEQTRDSTSDKRFFDNVRDGPDDPLHVLPEWVETLVVVQGHPMEGSVPPLATTGTPQRLPGGAEVVAIAAGDVAHVEDIVRGWGERRPVEAFAPVWPPGWDR